MGNGRWFRHLAWLLLAPVPALAPAQSAAHGGNGFAATLDTLESLADGLRADRPTDVPSVERSSVVTPADRRAAADARAGASRDTALRLIISLADRRLWAVRGQDTLRTARVAVGMDRRFTYDGRAWVFKTPRGPRPIRAKTASPVWVPPDWHYAEVARKYGLRLEHLTADRPVLLADGRWLELRDDEAGLVGPDAVFVPLVPDEEIVFDGTLYVPPPGTRNRRIAGELGRYQLDLGDGYLLHGTPHTGSIGTATTHGCVRLRDRDIAWLYAHVPIGTMVYIY